MNQRLTSWLLEELLSEKYQQAAAVKSYAPGDYVFHVGDPGDYMCVLLSGGVEFRKGEKTISVAGPGTMFGEMGLIDKLPRAADAVVMAHSRVMEIREGQFTSLVERNPQFSLSVMRLLTERLRLQTQT